MVRILFIFLSRGQGDRARQAGWLWLGFFLFFFEGKGGPGEKGAGEKTP